jgi:hypothetical protein
MHKSISNDNKFGMSYKKMWEMSNNKQQLLLTIEFVAIFG